MSCDAKARVALRSGFGPFSDGAGATSTPILWRRCCRGIDFVFEGAAGVVEACEVFRCGVEEEHATIADGASCPEFAQARSGPGDHFAIRRHDQPSSFAMDGAVRTDHGCIRAHAGSGNPEHGAGIFKRYFYGGRVGGKHPSSDSFAFGFADLVSDHAFTCAFALVWNDCSPGCAIVRAK